MLKNIFGNVDVSLLTPRSTILSPHSFVFPIHRVFRPAKHTDFLPSGPEITPLIRLYV